MSELQAAEADADESLEESKASGHRKERPSGKTSSGHWFVHGDFEGTCLKGWMTPEAMHKIKRS